MGDVYRARDSRLAREVAIKVASEHFSERFEREARAVAALNHPYICTLFDIGPNYLVMELVEGETLSERISQGPIALEDALKIATQIAEALAAAHDKGIVHRDLKPGNVMLKPDGSVKVLDFGLAKNVGTEAHPSSVSGEPLDSPTFSRLARTQAGVILGTAAYMAPEQAKGKSIDRRADVWAFGVVLYEMLTGKRLFQGEDMTETLAAVIMKEPDFEQIPLQVRRLVKRCLEKDPHKRLRDMGSVMLLLEDGSSPELSSRFMPPVDLPSPAVGRLPRWAWAAIASLALAGAFAAGYAIHSASSDKNASPPQAIANLTLDLVPAEMLGPATFYNRSSRTAFAISPDGTTVVYAGTVTKGDTRTVMLYRRQLAEPQATPIPGTERSGEYPFFSPDGKWVGFLAQAEGGRAYKLKKVALSGGPPIDICEIPGRHGGASWGSSGVVVFAYQGLKTCSDSGVGKLEVLLEDSPGIARFSPAFLPDGQSVLFTETSGRPQWKEAQVYAIDIKTKQRKPLLTDASDARYFPTGHLVFMRSAALLAVPFDLTRVEITGTQVPLLADVMQSTNAPNGGDETGMGQFAFSETGTLLYAPGGIYPTPSTSLVRVDRKGSETRIADNKGSLVGLRISPDGKRLVAMKTGDGSRAGDLYQYEIPAGTSIRLTSSGVASWPLWAPDGKSITFTQGAPNRGIFSLPILGGTTEQTLAPQQGELGFTAASLSPDGKWLAYLQTVNNVSQIFVRPMVDGKPDSGEPRHFSPSMFGQRDAEFSRDGKWIAYVTDESGADEVYVQPFPGPGEKRRVSKDGGSNPAWSLNGREIYYGKPRRDSTGARNFQMMAVDIGITGAFQASGHRVLFEGPYAATTPLRSYDITADGEFIMMRDDMNPPDQRVTKLNVVLGWGEELKRRVPASTSAK
jgi:serine/threonine-protein kinase